MRYQVFLFFGMIVAAGCNDNSDRPGGMDQMGMPDAQNTGGNAGGNYVWAKRLGGDKNDEGRCVAIDSSGQPIVAGVFSGTVDLGAGPLTSKAGTNTYLVKYATDGKIEWYKQFGDNDTAQIYAVAVDSNANIVIAGSFSGNVDFGGGPLTSTGFADAFVAKYSPAGTHLWSKHFGSGSSGTANGAAIDNAGNVVLGGSFTKTIDLGGSLLTSAGDSDIFIAKYSPSGAHIFSKRFGGPQSDSVYGVKTDSNGNLVLAGVFDAATDLGNGPLTSNGDWDTFVAKYSPTGTYLWSHQVGGIFRDVAYALTLDTKDQVILAGTYTDLADFGAGPVLSVGSEDGFLIKYAADGKYLWARHFGSKGPFQSVMAVTTDASDNIIAGGFVTGATDFGGGVREHTGNWDAFVAKYHADGKPSWSKTFGRSGLDVINGLAADNGGNLIVVGIVEESIDFGGGPLPAKVGNERDSFVLKLTP